MPTPGKEIRDRLNHRAAGFELPDVRLLNRSRAGVLLVATAAGVLCAAGPAAADVAVSPASAPRGSGADLTFRVGNPRTDSAITRIRLSLPADTAVAEVYPLSVPDWAPQMTQKHLATPLTTIHGGTPVTEATSSVTWTAMPGRALAPGGRTDLTIALGPLPQTSTITFEVAATYADGRTLPMPPAVVRLTPADPAQQGAHAGHDPAAPAAADDGIDYGALIAAQEDSGPAFWSLAGWAAAALCALAALVTVLRARRRAPAPGDALPGPPAGAGPDTAGTGDAPDRADTGDPAGDGTDAGAGKAEPVAAGTATKGWRYQDSP
jgi:Domain of unkown function (DUF1775)